MQDEGHAVLDEVPVTAEKPPLWWCVTCPAVAGILVPLVINFVCYWIGLAICKVFDVPKANVSLVLCASACLTVPCSSTVLTLCLFRRSACHHGLQ